MVPLLEKTMEEASSLHYDYMVGHYNTAIGQMNDGRFVQNGFAYHIIHHNWTNGKIVPPTFPLDLHTKTGETERMTNIIFELKKPLAANNSRPFLRRSPAENSSVAA